jgi:hypothetical protein
MKPVNIVVLLLAGALGGAVIMKVAQKVRPAVPAPAVAQVRTAPAPVAPAPPTVETPATSAVETPGAPAVETSPAEPETAAVPSRAKPSPMPVRRENPKPQRSRPVQPQPQPRPQPQSQAQPQLLSRSQPQTQLQPQSQAQPQLAGDPEPVERPVPPSAPEPPAGALAEPAPAPSSPSPPLAVPEPQIAAVPAPQPHQVTLNTGLSLPVRLLDGLSSERNAIGDRFLATLDKELVVDGFVIAERGARVEGRVVAVDRGGNAKGAAALAVELTRLHTSDGQVVAIQTDSFAKHAEVDHGQQAAAIGGGAIIGAVIGAIAGGGKGAAIGAGVGGGAGAGGVLLSRGKPAELPSETRVTFRLKTPVPLTERKGD